MITLPNFAKAFDYENDFYLSCQNARLAKALAHYELFKLSKDVPGVIIECGVFKGVSLVRFAAYRQFFGLDQSKQIVGFDTYGDFPATEFNEDKQARDKFIQDAGLESISEEQLQEVFKNKQITNVELVAGDITKTVPAYLAAHPDLKISLLNMDTDIYEPAVTILEYLYPHLSPGGILVSDDYGTFPGETKAVDDYFKGQSVEIKQFPGAKTPCYIVKS